MIWEVAVMAMSVRPAARRTPPPPVRTFGPESAGTLMTPAEFDRADFEDGRRYELIHGVLIVSPSPLENERDPNDELAYLLRLYRDTNPNGKVLDLTLAEHTVKTRRQRRRVDRAIWVGLGRLPRRGEAPQIIMEFVSRGKAGRRRDYEEKRDEFQRIDVKEYWVFDRFAKTLTVFLFHGGRVRKRVLKATQSYTTPLLPGFIPQLAKLITLPNRWPEGYEGE
jgi:Uma2 family endonuclease